MKRIFKSTSKTLDGVSIIRSYRSQFSEIKLIEGMSLLYSHLFENNGHGAKACKRRLQKICTYKSSKKQPIRTMKKGKQNTEKNKATGNRKYDSI